MSRVRSRSTTPRPWHQRPPMRGVGTGNLNRPYQRLYDPSVPSRAPQRGFGLVEAARQLTDLVKGWGDDWGGRLDAMNALGRRMFESGIAQQLGPGQSVRVNYSEGTFIGFSSVDEPPPIGVDIESSVIESGTPACAPATTPQELTITTTEGERVKVPVKVSPWSQIPVAPPVPPISIPERGSLPDNRHDRTDFTPVIEGWAGLDRQYRGTGFA